MVLGAVRGSSLYLRPNFVIIFKVDWAFCRKHLPNYKNCQKQCMNLRFKHGERMAACHLLLIAVILKWFPLPHYCLIKLTMWMSLCFLTRTLFERRAGFPESRIAIDIPMKHSPLAETIVLTWMTTQVCVLFPVNANTHCNKLSPFDVYNVLVLSSLVPRS